MNSHKRFFRVKYGYKVQDQISIDEQEVEKAIYAQTKGVPVKLGNAYINGRNIIAITPNYHKHTGWHEWYEPTDGEDWKQIERECPNYDGVLENYQERVRYLVENGREQEIGSGVGLPQLEEKSSVVPQENQSAPKQMRDDLVKKFKS